MPSLFCSGMGAPLCKSRMDSHCTDRRGVQRGKAPLALGHPVCERYQLTQMEYDILMFLYSNPQYNTAADIVKVRKSTKSHVSTSIKELENKGMIERIQSAHNKKHIEIVLLDKAGPVVEAGMDAQKQFAKNVLSGLTEEEMQICREIFDKICNNADKYLNNYKRRDDVK